jgi:hypothetical protein
MASQKAAEGPGSAGNPPELSSRSRRESRRIFRGCLSGHQDFLIGQVRRGRLACEEGQLEVVDDAVHHSIVCEESDERWALA